MRITFSLFVLLLFGTSLSAQNVGIGTASPAQKLELSGGNFEFDGALMPDGDAGTVGQVLTSQGAGNPPTWETSSSAPAKIWVEKLSSTYNRTANNVGGSLTLLSKTFEPVGDTVLVHFSMSGDIISSSGLYQEYMQDWGFRIVVNGSFYETIFVHSNTNDGEGRLSGAFTVPAAVNPGVANTISIQALRFLSRSAASGGSSAGSSFISMQIDPTSNFEHAYLTIQDIP